MLGIDRRFEKGFLFLLVEVIVCFFNFFFWIIGIKFLLD